MVFSKILLSFAGNYFSIRGIMKLFFRHFLYFSRRQQEGILTMIVILLAAIAFPAWYRQYKSGLSYEACTDTLHRQDEVEDFLSSIQKKTTSRPRPAASYPTEKPASEKVPVSLFGFDPNQADSLTLRKLGLPAWMAHNILQYRKKGGRFRKKEDFRKIYGLTDEQFAMLSPYIQIPPQPSAQATPRPSLLVHDADSVRSHSPKKYPVGTVIELNSADTTELQKIPGIGSGIARMIAGYRQQLGGFYHIEQLEEINLRSQLLRPWLRIDTSLVRRIPVNRASTERLMRHPYINFYQARAFVEHRRKTGAIQNLKPFILLEEFTREDLQRIEPYLDFSTSQTSRQPHTDSLPHTSQ